MPWLTTKQYAEEYGISQRTVQRKIQNGEIHAEREGRKYLIYDAIPQQEPGPLDEPSTTPEQTRYMTVQEYAELKGLSQRTIQRRCQLGLIEAERVGRRWQIPIPRVDDERPTDEHDFNIEEDDGGLQPENENNYDPSQLRKEFASYQDAVEYAQPIPVPWKIIKNQWGFYRVIVEYDVVVQGPEEEEEEPEEE